MGMKIKRLQGDFREFEEPIRDILMKSKNFVDMSTSLFPEFYNDEKVKHAIETTVQNVSRFRLLLDKRVDINELKKEVSWVFELKNKYPDKVKIAKATEDIMHHILIDEKYFRIESEHELDKSGKIILRNLIVEAPPRIIALQLIRQFDSWWYSAESVDMESGLDA